MKSGVYLVTQSEVKKGTRNMPFIRYWDGEKWYKCYLNGCPWGEPDRYKRKPLVVLRENVWLLGGTVVKLPKEDIFDWKKKIKSLFSWLK